MKTITLLTCYLTLFYIIPNNNIFTQYLQYYFSTLFILPLYLTSHDYNDISLREKVLLTLLFTAHRNNHLTQYIISYSCSALIFLHIFKSKKSNTPPYIPNYNIK